MNNNNTKVSIITLGCKVNEYESRVMFSILKDTGYDVTEGLIPADIYIINSCAVTSMAEKKSRQTLAKIKQINPNAKIIVCGCASQNDVKQFLDKGVYSVIGTSGKTDILNIIDNIKNSPNELPHEYESSILPHDTSSRQYIKVQDGCNNFCSYCIIPYLRGRSRSRDIESIIAEINNTKCNEIILTGINVSDFRINDKLALTELVSAVEGCKKRFRFSSLEVNIITDDLLQALARSQYFCPHFHLSLQSGCDETLKRMNRKYTLDSFEKAVNLIRKYFGDRASISTDIIVGFKGETEEEFEKTYNFCKKIKFSFIHIFPYSPRRGTAAFDMKGDVKNSIVKYRTNKLQELNKALKKEFLNLNINKIHYVLVEKIENKQAFGYTQNYIYCRFECKDCQIGDIVAVESPGYKNDVMDCTKI